MYFALWLKMTIIYQAGSKNCFSRTPIIFSFFFLKRNINLFNGPLYHLHSLDSHDYNMIRLKKKKKAVDEDNCPFQTAADLFSNTHRTIVYGSFMAFYCTNEIGLSI